MILKVKVETQFRLLCYFLLAQSFLSTLDIVNVLINIFSDLIVEKHISRISGVLNNYSLCNSPGPKVEIIKHL